MMVVSGSYEKKRGIKELTVSWALRSAGGSRGGEWRWCHFARGFAQSEGFRGVCGTGRCSCCICRELGSVSVIVEAGGTNSRLGVARFGDEKEGNCRSHDSASSSEI